MILVAVAKYDDLPLGTVDGSVIALTERRFGSGVKADHTGQCVEVTGDRLLITPIRRGRAGSLPSAVQAPAP